MTVQDMNANRVVNSLWIGNELSYLELLTLKSFLFHGHEFHLWTYQDIGNELPAGVIQKDANEIIAEEKVFRYKNQNQFGHGKGSVAGFSDIFRYKLLYEIGGWWVDMDVTCLRFFDFDTPYYFRSHNAFRVVGNVLKCPARSELMKVCYDKAFSVINESSKNWMRPIEILNCNIEKLELEQYIHKNNALPDHYGIVQILLHFPMKLPMNLYYIHWLNEIWRSKNKNKNRFAIRSTYGQLLQLYGIVPSNKSRIQLLKNRLYNFNCKIILYKYYLGNPVVFNIFNYIRRSILSFLRSPSVYRMDEQLTPKMYKSYNLELDEL